MNDDLSRSNGEKEGERGYRYRTREEWMEKLPPGTPISTSIFTRGFYYRDDVMRYRPSFWQEFRSSAARGFPLGDLFFKGMTLFLIFQPRCSLASLRTDFMLLDFSPSIVCFCNENNSCSGARPKSEGIEDRQSFCFRDPHDGD